MIFDQDRAPVGTVVLLHTCHPLKASGNPFERIVLRWSKDGQFVKLGIPGEAQSGREDWHDTNDLSLIEVLTASRTRL